MKSTIPAPAAALLDFLAKFESKGNYLAYFGHSDSTAPLPATLADVLQFQSDLVRVHKQKSSALGRYQFMPTTLRSLMNDMKLPGATPFTPDLQDELGFRLLKRRGYDKWMAGSLGNEGFADNLSMEWASMPYQTGKSYYDGDGLNHSLVSRERFVGAIAGAASLVAKSALPDAAPVASRPTPSAASPIVEKALNPAPARGTSPAPGSATPNATKESTMGNLLGSVASMIFGAAMKAQTVATVATAAPSIIEGAFKSLDEAERGIKALIELANDIKGGKWNEVPEDISAIIAEFRQIMVNFGIDHDGLNTQAAKIADMDSVATLKKAA